MLPDTTTAVPWATVIGVGVPVLGAFGAVLVFFVKRLLGSQQQLTDLRFATVVKQQEQANTQLAELSRAFERLREHWVTFQTDYTRIDSTRGAKIDALFRVVDQMEETLRDVKPMVRSKVDDAFARACSELRLFVREQLREGHKDGQ